ncbi:MAG: DUF3619 family protein [Betaproteobacteria bacterium]|nr:DUF3619 family protein [Betaproteobacteria bacterium]
MSAENQLARRIVTELNHSLQGIEPSITERLRAARAEALAHHRVRAHALSLAGIGHGLADIWFSHGRSALIAAAIIGILIAGGIWRDNERVSELTEVDSALLSDDLPIDAYLDHGFDRWLKHDSDASHAP